MARKNTMIKTIQEKVGNIKYDASKFSDEILIEIKDKFSDFTDSRYQPNVKHIYGEVIGMALIALLAGNDTWIDIEEFCELSKEYFKKYFLLPAGIPSHDTFERCFKILDNDELLASMVNVVTSIVDKFYLKAEGKSFVDDNKSITDIIAVDGKAMLGSYKASSKYGEVKKLQLLNVYSTEYGLCLSSTPIDEKTNEIPVSQSVLSTMKLNNKIVTCDALNTQKEFSKIIVNQKGDYVLALKENQHDIYEDVKLYFSDENFINEIKSKAGRHLEQIEKNHSKIEKRYYYVLDDVNWYYRLNEWTGIKSFVKEEKIIENLITGEISKEERYFISTLTDVNLISIAIRRHWNIENNLHWQLDYTFGDDSNTTSDKESARALSIMKRFALSLIQIVKGFYGNNVSIRRIRKRMSYGFKYIEEFFSYLSASNHII